MAKVSVETKDAGGGADGEAGDGACSGRGTSSGLPPMSSSSLGASCPPLC